MSEEPRRVCRFCGKERLNHLRPGRTPGWLLLPLRGNSPSAPGRRYLSGCKCGASCSESNRTIASGNCSILFGLCFLSENKACAQQTAKFWRKSPKGFFANLKRRPGGEPGRRFGKLSHGGSFLAWVQFSQNRLSEAIEKRRNVFSFRGKIPCQKDKKMI